MSDRKPLVSIGLPVYNGEEFLSETLDSILAQTFKDFELIISDNASTDKTQAICQQYAAKDGRIRYYRNDENIGASPNYNRTFELSTGKYFKWVAHDDLHAPEYLERCVEILDRNPSIVLCHSKVRLINDKGKVLKENDKLYKKYPCMKDYHAKIRKLNTDSLKPQERFLARVTAGISFEIFGLIRASTLRMIPKPLHGSYSRSDDILLARIALLGRFYEIPEFLFSSRQHLKQSGMFALTPDGRLDDSLYSLWFDPASKESDFISRYGMAWKLNYEYGISILQSPLSQQEKIECYQCLSRCSNQPDLLCNLGELAQREGQHSTAEKFFGAFLQVQPKSVKGWFGLGNLRQMIGKLPEAEEAYRQALALQPNLVSIHNNLGYTLQQQGKWEEAIACYQKALDIQPKCVEAEVNLASALYSQDKLSPDRQIYYAAKNNDLGLARKLAGDYKTAVAYYQQAIALQPDLAIAHYNLGVALQEQGKLEEAIACYQQVLEIPAKDGEVYHQLVRNKLNRIYKGQDRQKGTKSRARSLKIAFVSQYCDTLIPPYQNSVGGCTYGVVRPLAECCQIITYGIKHSEKLKRDYCDRGVHYKFLSPSRLDLWLFERFQKYGKFIKLFNGGMISPPSTSNWVFPMYGREVARDLVQEQCDIIVFQHTTQYIPIVRALNPKAKIILNFHHERYPQSNRAMLERRIRYVDAVTCVSDYVAKKTRQDFPLISDRCQTIYNGIEASDFAREKDYNQARQRKVKHIMYAGAVSPEKGLHILLDAFQIVVQSYPEVQLEIFGPQGARPLEEMFPQKNDPLVSSLRPFYSGNYISHLQEKLSPDIAEKVSFPGMIPRPQLIDRFFNADIFVFPSLWDEGFGLPPLEAMAAGTPVVAARSGAVVETVQDGKTGFLVEKNNAPALAASILRLLENDDLRESMSRAARQRAWEYFTWDRTADAMLQLYETLCEC